MSEQQLPSAKLFFKEGSSDKVYEAVVEAVEGGYLVNFAFGRRGAKLQTGTKTTTPVDLKEATLIFEKLIKEKTNKGYTPDEEGTPFISSKDESKVSGYLPQLLNAIEKDEVDYYLKDDQWLSQEKHDGQRILMEVKDGNARAINRRGLYVEADQAISREALILSQGHPVVLDGEMVGGTYFVFDILIDDQDLRSLPYFQRYARLQKLFGTVSEDLRSLRLVDSAYTTAQKESMLEELIKKNAEGIVLKRNAPYQAGRPNTYGDQLKYKFNVSASVFVTGINTQRSVSIAVLKADQVIPVGNVTILPNMTMPVLDDVLEVKYLYAMKETNALFQPVCLGLRKDISKDECTIDQLKYKS